VHKQFHIQFSPPHANWPKGSWSLYEITGDEIAKRIGFGANGEVDRRDPWPGYLGTFDSPEKVGRALEHHTAKALSK
jgi:hypothetical protein